jgi:hypothetical protein
MHTQYEHETFRNRMSLRTEYRNLLSRFAMNYFVTFSFGYAIKPESARKPLQKFCNALERRALGRFWNKHRGPDRLVLFAFGEHMNSNPHWHAVAQVPERTECFLIGEGDEIWLKIEARGQLWVEPARDPERVLRYSTKRLTEFGAADRVFIYKPPPGK